MSRHKLISCINSNQRKIPYKKDSIDVSQCAKYRFEQLAVDISQRVVNKLNRERSNIQDEVYTTFIVGGGALLLPEYLPKYLKDYQLEFSEEPIYANAKGYYKMIFCTELGKPIEPRNLMRKFYGIVKKADIDKANFHCLRNTFATRAIEKSMNPKVLQEILGHASIQTTLDIYSHVFPETKKADADKLNDLFKWERPSKVYSEGL